MKLLTAVEMKIELILSVFFCNKKGMNNGRSCWRDFADF